MHSIARHQWSGGPINPQGSGPCVQMLTAVIAADDGSITKALPPGGQLDGRLPHSPQRLRGHKALPVKGLCPREHIIHGPRQLVGQHGERFALAMFAFQLGEILFAGVVLA